MREEKKQRLEARGWRVGSATEFLGLSPEEEQYIELKLQLSLGLRPRREARHLTQVDAAKLLRSSQSRFAKMEAGDASVSVDLLIRALLERPSVRCVWRRPGRNLSSAHPTSGGEPPHPTEPQAKGGRSTAAMGSWVACC